MAFKMKAKPVEEKKAVVAPGKFKFSLGQKNTSKSAVVSFTSPNTSMNTSGNDSMSMEESQNKEK